MSDKVEQKVPDIGDFTDVEVIEVHVSVGDAVAVEDPLITLETDKASMDVPATAAGTVASVEVAQGDRVSEGSLIATVAATLDRLYLTPPFSTNHGNVRLASSVFLISGSALTLRRSNSEISRR